MGVAVEAGATVTEEFAARILAVAREHRRERLVLEFVCIHWELSHFELEHRTTVEELLAQKLGAPALGRMLEDSIRGRANDSDWARLFESLGM
jgi:hypothetical protein